MLLIAAFFAGFIDAVAGGGGLIQIPALMLIFPGAPFATIAGTNKISSIFGTVAATRRYLKTLKPDRTLMIWSILPAIAGSLVGAKLAATINNEIVRPLVIIALFAVYIFTIIRPQLGQRQIVTVRNLRMKAVTFGALIGVYDGLIGPGAGTFLLFGGVTIFGLDFLAASANAKLINIATNATALTYFLYHGQYFGQLALLMAAFNICGAELGARCATSRGSNFVRKAFLKVVPALILKLTYDWLS